MVSRVSALAVQVGPLGRQGLSEQLAQLVGPRAALQATTAQQLGQGLGVAPQNVGDKRAAGEDARQLGATRLAVGKRCLQLTDSGLARLFQHPLPGGLGGLGQWSGQGSR